MRLPTSLSIFTFISSIRLGRWLSTWMERYLRDVCALLKQRERKGQAAQSATRAW